MELQFAAKAGDCIIFDLATYHTAQPNSENKSNPQATCFHG